MVFTVLPDHKPQLHNLRDPYIGYDDTTLTGDRWGYADQSLLRAMVKRSADLATIQSQIALEEATLPEVRMRAHLHANNPTLNDSNQNFHTSDARLSEESDMPEPPDGTPPNPVFNNEYFVRATPVINGSEKTGIYYPGSTTSVLNTKPWDVFKLLVPRGEIDFRKSFWADVALQLLKLTTYIVTLFFLLATATIAKGTFLFMTSGVGWAGQNVSWCGSGKSYFTNATVEIENRHVVKWIWSLYLSLCMPEVFCFIRCIHRVLFRNVKRPSPGQFFAVLLIETLHAAGVGLLVFKVLPGLDAVTGAMLTSCFCFVPAVLTMVSRKPSRLSVLLVIVDLVCIGAQSSGFWAWPVFIPSMASEPWAVPLAIFLISMAWWENFVSKTSVFPCIRRLAFLADNIKQVRSKTYAFISPWKCLVYLAVLFASTLTKMSTKDLFEPDPFGSKPYHMTAYRRKYPTAMPYPDDFEPVGFASTIRSTLISGNTDRVKREITMEDATMTIMWSTPYDALWVFLIQALAAFACYQCAKFSCKVMIQRFAFALPLNMVVPLTVAILVSLCSHRKGDICYLTEVLSPELFWKCVGMEGVNTFVMNPQTWIWTIWLLSQFWITAHIWLPKCERLADTDRLFVLPWYSAAFTDQCLALNRRRDDKSKIKTEEIELDGEDGAGSGVYETISNVRTEVGSVVSGNSKSSTTLSKTGDMARSADSITKIYACATMWHETKQEMICMLKSIFRLDEDQCARRNAQKYLKVVDPDYYEFEAHIFFDDAFSHNDYGEPVVNQYVQQLLEVINIAAGAVHQTEMMLKAPKKFATPYGGRILWTLPGKNRLTVHMKDTNKIKKRKRWSQVMYLYYLLGHKLMEKVDDIKRKEIIAENTYILTLDGDVDFHPHAVHLLVDLMKKNRRLGAACGRIHPRGVGPMIWYQKFEYAIGHWFQKATEHMIGCVLCAPGCFSLFRSAALMDHNVLRKYATKAEKAKDCIQYDQGEDRWLCTLLLQRGYRVEYCAASDALTFAPQSFNEFFKQRKRWMPSTVANIIDLLADYKAVVKLNDSISIWYIIYQFAMLLSSILGPGTIFLMIVGAVNISFVVNTYWSLMVILIPVIFFMIVCFTCKLDTQHLVAQIISAFFALLMMAVIVGTALQIKKDGIYSPHAIFLFAVMLSFFVAACLHPLEFTCIIPGILYFLAVPCTYMLLTIYSVCNLHTVSWGTRESALTEEEEKKQKRKGKNISLFEENPLDPSEIDGMYNIGCGNSCRLLCCLQPSSIGNSPQMVRLTEKLEQIDKKMDRLDKRIAGTGANIRRGSSLGLADNRVAWEQQALLVEEDEPIDDNFDLPYHKEEKEKAAQSESWLNDSQMRHAQRDTIDDLEKKFWTDLIDKYLNPREKLDKQAEKQAEQELKADLHILRNQVAFAFFMLNALFILIVILLQTQKNCLYVEWPLGPLVNHTKVPCNADKLEEITELSRLQLEPIGFVFLIFFMSILLVQFIAMLLHRFGTMSHILAATELFCWRKSGDKLSDDDIVIEHAVEIAKELQAIRGVDEDSNCSAAGDEDQTISRRRVIRNLDNSRRSGMKRRTETLDAAFKKRFFRLSSEKPGLAELNTPIIGQPKNLTLRKGTIRALEQRRNSHFGTLDKGQMPIGSDSNMAGDNSKPRGPAKRRLDQLFPHRSGDPIGDPSDQLSSSDDEDQLQTVPPGKQPPLSHSAWTEREGVGNPLRRPLNLRKIISQNAWNNGGGGEAPVTPPEQRSGLLQSDTRQSSSSSVEGRRDESHF